MKPPQIVQFQNCRLVRNHEIVVDDIWVRDGKVINPERVFFDEQVQADVQIDCKNALIAPGFIDLQINGGFGVDFSFDVDTVEAGVNKVAKALLAHGVTSFCPTVVTSPTATYKKILPKIPKRNGNKNGATILGVHIEGPFINPEKKGAHPIEFIRNFDNGITTVEDMYGNLENVKIITLAPEKPRSPEVIKNLTERGIIVSIGHSTANLCDGEEAVQNGARLITHLFNAMLPFHHRDPGLVGLLASEKVPAGQTIYYGIIADGVHTHPAALRIALRTHADGLIIVTDAISALGLEEGFHHIGQYHMEVRNRRAYLAATDTLCGSIASMDECIRTFKQATYCTTVFALEAASLHPAKCLGISHQKGSLSYGSDADFVFLDDDLNVLSTWIAGECVFISNKQKSLKYTILENVEVDH